MGYINASTENPLGKRPFNAQLTQQVIPPAGFRLSGYDLHRNLSAYFPANYYVPTPLNISMCPTPNVVDPGMGFLGDFINNVQWLRPGQWRSRDDDYSPIPRIYVPPELTNNGLSGLRGSSRGRLSLGDDASFDWIDLLLRRRGPQFSGGVRRTDYNNPSGFFFPRTPAVPYQFPIHAAHIWGPDPANPTGLYFPRIPQPVLPAWLRARSSDWTGADSDSLTFFAGDPAFPAGLGQSMPTHGKPTSLPFKLKKASKPLHGLGVVTPVAHPIVSGSAFRATAPVSLPPEHSAPILVSTPPVTIGPPRSPSGTTIFTRRTTPAPTPVAPVVTPGTPPTLPPNVISAQGGICTVESSPETGSVVSSVPCNTLPGYSAGTSPTVALAPVPATTFGTWPLAIGTPPVTGTPSNYAAALALIQAGGTLTSAQLATFTAPQQSALINAMNANITGVSNTAGLTPAQIAQLQAAQASQAAMTAAGGGGTAPAYSGNGGGDTSGTADILGWLSQSSLIQGVPNWVIAGGGGLLVLWIMNRGKR
jgi:hypothetical protein